ncbi:MAG TPA: hypothetical protein VN512_13055 [Clostridia bacterium]|nr:hypothetical protein [Clostridia bacterium]
MKTTVLCRPCTEHLKKCGEKLVLMKHANDMKITCDRCGLRKYGAVYVREAK